jgi:hypothetical protein
MNTKVVGLATNNIFYKGYIGFTAHIGSYLNASRVLQTVNFALQLIFQGFPLKIENANLHESCVPHQDVQLS